MRSFYCCLLLYFISVTGLLAQKSLLQSGPMLGYSEMREVMLWVQTNESAEVQFAYWLSGDSSNKQFTETYQTKKTEAYTAKMVADDVEPGNSYQYELLINGKVVNLPYPTTFQTQTLWQYRNDPPAFTMAVGSCSSIGEAAYERPGDPYGGNYEIFTAIHEKQVDAMLWLGDNTYLREADYYSQSGILKRYTHTRSLAEMQPLLASTHHYAIWDDHDYGPNDSDRSYVHKDKSLYAFTRFWGNPTFGVNRQPGVTTAFKWADIDFFLLDNRYFRSPNDRSSGRATILGEEQLEWLIDALAASKAPFKMVANGGQVLNTAPVYENYSRLAPEERAYLLQRIAEENITGVVFLTGDRHHTEFSSYTNFNGHAVYDLTASPLTSGTGSSRDNEHNRLRDKGTLLLQRNFALLTFSGPRTDRELLIQVFDVNGEMLWERNIEQERYKD